MDKIKIVRVLNKITDKLTIYPQLDFSHPNLPTFSDSTINSKLGDILPKLVASKSHLADKLPDLGLLTILFYELESRNAIKNLDHIGFCYKVESNIIERESLILTAKKTGIPIYEEPSNDSGLWLFAGDISNIANPMLEIVPIEQTTDLDKEYWLPHIQIDIDTNMTADDISALIKSNYKNSITPSPFIIDGTTYIIRNRLGIVDGINIFLDLATSARDVSHLRRNIWKKID